MGTQQDLLQAQLQQTKLLREIAMHHLEVGKLEAQIKQLLNRPQDSPDIEPTDLVETPIVQTYAELLAAAEAQNPEIATAKKMIEKQSLQVDLAHKDFYPDFNVQYMWQRTDPTQFRAYYMLSVGVRVPIYRGRKQRPELAQAEAEKLRAGSELQAQALPPQSLARVHRMLMAVQAELERSVSPALAGELHRLLDGGGAEPSAAEVRMEYASLLGWAGGLVIAMLGQLEAAQHIPYMPTASSP